MKKFLNTFIFCILIFTLTLTTFSCANLLDALKDAFPPPGKAGEDIQNENPTEPNKPTTDGNNQGSNSGGTDKLKPVESYPYKSTVNLTVTGLDEGTYFIEPKIPSTDSLNENIIFKERAFIQNDKSYTFGIEENELLSIVFDFIDLNSKEVIMRHCVELKQEQILEEVLNIIEFNTTVNISGDYSNYNNPKLLFQVFPKWDNFPVQKIYDITSQPINISMKWAEEYAVPYLVIFNDTDNDNDYKNLYFNRDNNNDDYAISNIVHGMREPDNSTEFTFNLEIFDSATLLPSLLDESQFIEIINPVEYNPSDETTKYYRFEKINSRWTFLIPAGTGSDGEFITCYFCENNLEGHSGDHLWNLLNKIGISHNEKFSFAQRNQTTEWHNYIKQIITYLQDEKGLTVQNIPDFFKKDNNNNVDNPSTNEGNQGNTSDSNTENKYETITKIESGNAVINVNLTGINSDLYYVLCEGTEKPYSQQENLFMFDTVENEEFEVRLSLYRKDNNEYFTSTFSTLKDGEQKDVIVEIAKYNVEVVINGDYSKYENPKISVNSIRNASDIGEFSIYNINEKNITVFYITSNHEEPTNFILVNDIDDDDTIIYRDWNGNDYDLSLRTSAIYKDNNTMDAIVSLDILESINLLNESQMILGEAVDYNPSDETTKYFRFEQRSDTKWTFIVPAGTGSDGEFITCYFCENNLEGHNNDHIFNLFNIIRSFNVEEFDFAQRNQTTEWHNYIKQIITYLQDEKGLTVQNIPDFLQD